MTGTDCTQTPVNLLYSQRLHINKTLHFIVSLLHRNTITHPQIQVNLCPCHHPHALALLIYINTYDTVNIVLFACKSLYIWLYSWDKIQILLHRSHLSKLNLSSVPLFLCLYLCLTLLLSFYISVFVSRSHTHRVWVRRLVCPPVFFRPCGWTAAQTVCPLHSPPCGTCTHLTPRWHTPALH